MSALELLEIFSEPKYEVIYAYAKATRTCIKCGKPAKKFRDASARLEYAISALCETCQEKYFNRCVILQ